MKLIDYLLIAAIFNASITCLLMGRSDKNVPYPLSVYLCICNTWLINLIMLIVTILNSFH